MPYNDYQKAYNLKYKKDHLKRVPLDLTLSKYDLIKDHSQKLGESVNGFIKRAIDETIERDNLNNLSLSSDAPESSN